MIGGVAVAPKARPAGRLPIRVLPMMLAEPVSVPHLRIVVVATGPAGAPTGGIVTGPTARLTRPGPPGWGPAARFGSGQGGRSRPVWARPRRGRPG